MKTSYTAIILGIIIMAAVIFGITFDPKNQSTTYWLSLQMTLCDYPWHESKHEKTFEYYQDYITDIHNYDSSNRHESAGAMHYVITRYYEDQGKTILDINTSFVPIDPSIDQVGCTAPLDGVWHVKVLQSNLEYFLNDGFVEDSILDLNQDYEIEITGLKDTYLVGERYDFSYIISGYGYSCGGKEVTFPGQNGDYVTIASRATCFADATKREFVFDIQKEQGTTFGHVVLNAPGTYAVTVTFDRPSQESPTTTSKEFRVIGNEN